MELTRRGFLAGAGAVGALGTMRSVASKMTHDPNLMVFFSDIHQHDNTVRWKNGPTQANVVLPELVKDIVTAPTVFGYIFGHDHEWKESFLHSGYSDSRTVQTATLPSGGFWGDIGYALFRTFEDRAELTVRQTDFYFNRRWPDKPRPKNWIERIKMHDGRMVTFWYDKPGNFYG